MSESAIVDTSVLIALEKVRLLNLLDDIYEEIILPEGVIDEFGEVGVGCYAKKKVDSKLVRVLIQDLNLGKGGTGAGKSGHSGFSFRI